MTSNDGTRLIQSVDKWQRYFAAKGEAVHMNLAEAIDKLKEDREYIPTIQQIPCGILAVDRWLGGGLRTKNVALWMGKTGHGKTAVMVFSSHFMATVEDKKVWYITNEQPWNEITERFLARFTGVKLEEIMEDPIGGVISQGAQFIRSSQIHENLYISDVPHGLTVNELESYMARLQNLYGWSPDVIVLDHMERCRPIMKGINRDSSWIWMGEVARDLVSLAKRRNVAIWSAIQTNRPGLQAKELQSEHAQGSIQQLQEVTAVVSLHQPDDVGDEQIIEFKALKMRQSKHMPKPIKLHANLATMTITNKVYEAEEVDRSQPVATMQGKKGKVPFNPQRP